MGSFDDLTRYYRALSKEGAEREIRLFNERAGNPKWLFRAVNDDTREPWQGDVIPEIMLPRVTDDGEVEGRLGPAVVLSTTCDTVPGQDASSVLAPAYDMRAWLEIFPEDQRAARHSAIRSNRFTRLMYLPANGDVPERIINFSEAASVSTIYLNRLAERAPVAERTRFSHNGWYFFSFKLSYYYTRAEDEIEIPR